jgi:hypothetical protein
MAPAPDPTHEEPFILLNHMLDNLVSFIAIMAVRLFETEPATPPEA